MCVGVDIRGPMVQYVARPGCMDVHCFHSEPVRYLTRSVRGRHEAHHLSKHHVALESQAPHRRPLGAFVRHMFPATRRLEGHTGD